MRTCGTAATTAAGTQQRGEAAEREHGGVGRAPGLIRQARGIPSSSMATITSGTEGGEHGTFAQPCPARVQVPVWSRECWQCCGYVVRQ